MLRKMGTSRFTRPFWGFIAVLLINLSIDTPSPEAPGSKENLAYNDQESMVEWFVEQGLGFEDAIQEFDDKQNRNKKQKQQNLKYWNFAQECGKAPNQHLSFIGDRRFPFCVPVVSSDLKEVDPPPPKA